MSTNFRESLTNTPGKKFLDFYFCDKVTISDHTPYNFPHVNGDLQRVFQRQNDSKTLACLSKRVGRCRQKLPCRREGADSEDLFAVAVRSRKISAVCSMHSTRGTILSMLDGSTTNFLSIYWICGSNTLCSASSARQQEIFASWRLITKIMKISRYTVVLSLPPRLIPVLLNGMKYSELDIIILKVLVCMCLYLLS